MTRAKTKTKDPDVEALHHHIDANPSDHHARLVLADKLDDIGSPLGEGYRVLGNLKFRFESGDEDGSFWWTCWSRDAATFAANITDTTFGRTRDYVPMDWFKKLRGGGCFMGVRSVPHNRQSWRDYPSRRALEDALALAFSKLPDNRRREISNLKAGDA